MKKGHPLVPPFPAFAVLPVGLADLIIGAETTAGVPVGQQAIMSDLEIVEVDCCGFGNNEFDVKKRAARSLRGQSTGRKTAADPVRRPARHESTMAQRG